MKNYLFLIVLFIGLFNSLLAQNQPEVVVTNGHVGQVSSVSFHPEGLFVATGGMDKSIKIWDKNLQQEFRTLNGHKSRIEKLAFSANGKYLVSLENLENLYVWSFPTGKLLYTFENQDIKNFVLSKNNQDFYVSQDRKIIRYELSTGKLIENYTNTSSSLLHILPTTSPNLLLQMETISEDIQIYDVNGQTITGTLEGTGEIIIPTSLALAKEQALVAASSVDHKIRVWNWETKKVVLDLDRRDLPVAPDLVFSPDGKTLFLKVLSLNKVISYDINTGKELPEIDTEIVETAEQEQLLQRVSTGVQGLTISPDGQSIGIALTLMDTQKDYTTTIKTGVKFWTLATRKPSGTLFSNVKNTNHLSVTSDNKYVLTSSLNTPSGLKLWNLEEGQIDQYFVGSGLVVANKNGDIIGIVEGDKIQFYAFPNFELIGTKKIGGIPFPMTISDDGFLAAYSTSDISNHKPFLEVIDIKTGVVKMRINRKQRQPVAYLQLSPDNQYLFVGDYGKMSCWEISTGRLLYEKEFDPIYDFLDINGKAQTIVVSQLDELLEIDIKTGEIKNRIETQLGGRIYCGDFSLDYQQFAIGLGNSYAADYEYTVGVIDWQKETLVCTMEGHTSDINFVDFSSDGQTVYSAASDGLVKIWDLENCTNTATLIAMNEEDYLILTPDNYYKNSKSNLEGVGFRYQNKLYGIDQFDLKFNRPDKVAIQLGASKLQVRMYEKAYQKRLERNGISNVDIVEQLNLPTIKINNRTEVPLVTRESDLSLHVEAAVKTGNLAQFNVYINNIPLYGVEGQTITGDSYTKRLTIPLSQGKNKIQVSVVSEQGLESTRETINITHESPQEITPDLYLVAIGVSEYADENFNLKFATKDAQDLVTQFEKSPQYNKVYTKTFFNKAATLDNIATLNSFFEAAKIDDHIIFYISAHGLLDDDFNYYLATYSVDFQNPIQQGLAYEKIEALLGNAKARNRLIMIDACHAGEIDKTETMVESSNEDDWGDDVFRFSTTKSGVLSIKPKAGLKNSFDYMKALFNDVSKNIGATIIAAAGGYEYALESEEWNNGVFTYALLEGIQSKNADSNGDDEITISELKNYIIQQVEQLTNGEQVPTTRKENLVNDFRVW